MHFLTSIEWWLNVTAVRPVHVFSLHCKKKKGKKNRLILFSDPLFYQTELSPHCFSHYSRHFPLILEIKRLTFIIIIIIIIIIILILHTTLLSKLVHWERGFLLPNFGKSVTSQTLFKTWYTCCNILKLPKRFINTKTDFIGK